MVMCKLVVLRSGQSAGPGGPDPLALSLSKSGDNEATVTHPRAVNEAKCESGQKGLLGVVAAQNNGVSILFKTKTLVVEQS